MLLALSLTHTRAGFDVLERATAAVAGLSTEQLLRTTMRTDQVAGAVVVSTCNRLEAYLEVPRDAAEPTARRLLTQLAERAGAPEIPARAAVHRDADALRHLFAVSSGLDSLVIGEEEIAGQVARAYEGARRIGATTPVLDRSFQRAIRTSRMVRAQGRARADRGEVSVVHLALELADGRVADWRTARILLVGTGAHARTAVRALHARGAERVTVYSATGRAAQFAQRHSLHAGLDGTPLAAAVADAELVIACTGRAALGHADVTDREARPLLVVDLGLPHNVDPAIAAVPGVELLDLAGIAHHVDLPGLGASAAAAEVVRGAVEHYAANAAAAPLVTALRGRVGDVLDGEIARARRRAGDEAEAARTEAALRHLVGVLLHTPSTRLREAAAQGRLTEVTTGLEALLGLDLEGPDS